MTPEQFVPLVTRTVTAFEPMGQRYVNTETGAVMRAGQVSFDCGHSYAWHPWGVRTAADCPSVGKSMMCSACITVVLDGLAE